jgi:hypothetical protein
MFPFSVTHIIFKNCRNKIGVTSSEDLETLFSNASLSILQYTLKLNQVFFPGVKPPIF